MRWGSSHSASLGAQDGTVGQTVNTPGAECVSREDIRGDGTSVWRGRFRTEAGLCTEVAQSMFPSTEKKRKGHFLLSRGHVQFQVSSRSAIWEWLLTVLKIYTVALSVVGICIFKLLNCIRRKIIASFDVAEYSTANGAEEWRPQNTGKEGPLFALLSSLTFLLFSCLARSQTYWPHPERGILCSNRIRVRKPQNDMEQTSVGIAERKVLMQRPAC